MRIFISITLIAFFFMNTSSRADQNGLKAAELLSGVCYHTIDNVERVSPMASSLGWVDAPKDVYEANRPIDANGYKMWKAPDINGPVFVSINKGKWSKGEPTNICSIVVNINKENLMQELKKEMVIGKEFSQKQPFQVVSMFRVENKTVKKLFLQIIHDGKGGRPINAIMVGIK